MILLRIEIPFSATHQIDILGELEPVHGHDFRCLVELESEDARDASLVAATVRAALAGLSHTHLGAVALSEGGKPSAERIARHLHHEIGRRLDPALRVARVTVHESPGCSASYSSRARANGTTSAAATRA